MEQIIIYIILGVESGPAKWTIQNKTASGLLWGFPKWKAFFMDKLW